MVRFDFAEQTAVVTGGAQGIGLAIVKRLLNAGARVSIWDADKAGAAATVKALDGAGDVRVCHVDVSNADSVEAAGAETLDALGRIDILVNNAGITRDQIFMRMSDEEWQQVLDVNLTSTMRLCRGVMRGMMKARWDGS